MYVNGLKSVASADDAKHLQVTIDAHSCTLLAFREYYIET